MTDPAAVAPADAVRGAGAPTGLVAEVIRRHFGVGSGELLVGGLPIGAIVERFGTPLFVYDLGVVRQQVERLRAVLPRGFSLCYSVKANPNPAILRWFVAHGLGLEIASSGELEQALAAGCPPEEILFAGPGKTEAELRHAVAAGVGEIHLESLTEARRLDRIARQAGRKVRVALRVNPAADVEGGGMRMGARAVPFGIDEDQLEPVVAAVLEASSLDLVGLHLFVGTQIQHHDVLLRQYAEALQIARRLSERIGRPLQTIDLGGGLGVPYFANDAWLDLDALGTGLRRFAEDVARDARLAGARFVLEPGRFLVAESGVYVCRVNDVKSSRGRLFAVTDGGMHHHLAASGNLGQTIKRNFPVALVNRLGQPGAGPVDVVGPLCTPLDMLGRAVDLPCVEVDDLVGVFQSGAYGLTASPGGFLSRPTPAEVVVDGGVAHLARAAGTPSDYVRLPVDGHAQLAPQAGR